MISHLKNLVTTPRALGLLLAISLLKGLTWSIIIPPWHAPDENTHFSYGQMIERFGVLHPTPSTWVNGEISASWDVTQIHPVRFDPNLYLDLSDRATIAAKIARVGSPALKRAYVYDDGYYFYFFYGTTFSHPPLYYFVIGALQATLEDTSILVRILALRGLSVILGVILTALAFHLGKIIFQSEAWALLLATLVSFHPMITFMTSVINSNSLEILMFSLCLLLILQTLRTGLSARRAMILGLALGASLLTRASLVSIIPLIVLAFLGVVFQLRRTHRLNLRAVAPWALAVVITILLAGWWYWDSYGHNPYLKEIVSITIGNGGSPVKPGAESAPRLGYFNALLQYDWLGTYSRVLEMYWGDFGWLDTPMPQWLWTVLTWLSLVAVVITMAWVIRRVLFRSENNSSASPWVILFLGIATLPVIAFYTSLDLTTIINSTGRYGLQGRYFLPPIIAQMIWLALGLVWVTPARWRAAAMWLLGVGMIALNLFSLFSVIALRYYGARNLMLVVDRATVLQPVPASALFVLIAIYFTALALFVPIFWRALRQESLPAL